MTGTIEVRAMLNEAVVDGVTVKLTPSQADLLAVLAATVGKTVPRWRLKRTLWNEVNRRDEPDDKTFLVHMHHLRRRLSGTRAVIETVGRERGPGAEKCEGYRLTGVEAAS